MGVAPRLLLWGVVLLGLACRGRASLKIVNDINLPADASSGQGAKVANIPVDSGAEGSDAVADARLVPGRPLQVGAHEAVRRIARLLFKAEPDAALLIRAEKIKTVDDLEALVSDLLRDSRAARGVGGFYRWWLELDRLASISPDPKLFSFWSPGLATEMADDAEAFGVAVTLQRDGLFSTLMTGSQVFSSGRLLMVFGRDPMLRPGILTRPAFAALWAWGTHGSPVQRGMFVRSSVMCMDLPSHPQGTVFDVSNPLPGLTTREHYQSLIRGSACVTCHRLIDPLGYGFENFDAVGVYRLVEAGKAIDASGFLAGPDGASQSFSGPGELVARLAVAPEARNCLVRQWFRYALNRPETPADQPSVQAATRRFEMTGGNLRELIVAVATSNAFLR